MKSLKQLFDLSGKSAFVTGGAGYLGSAMCETLAELGADIIIGSRDREKCEKFAKKLEKKFDITANGVKVDVTNPKELDKVFSFINNKYGGLDILINNAYSGKKNTFESIDFEEWKCDIDTGLTGVFMTVKKMFPLLKISEGVIINIASMYGHIAPDYRIYESEDLANPPSYGAAKAGVIQLTKYLASFLSPYGIRVNAISPGPYPFPETQKNRGFMKMLESKTILNRIGQPEDLKGITALLCSDASNYMTGQNVCVDGGWGVW